MSIDGGADQGQILLTDTTQTARGAGNLVLCGFMGCGKTTVGKSLADRLGRQFVDMDVLLERREGKSIPALFAAYGEEGFRAMETRAARDLAACRGLVIAAGGGAAARQENVAAFRAGGKVVFLDVPLEVLRRRLAGDRSRPLLNRADKDEAMRTLYEKRLPLYRAAADLTVFNESDAPADRVAALLAEMLRNGQRSGRL